MSLLGRAGECAVLDALVDDVRAGAGRSLVLRGEPGIGKSALLRYLVDSAPDLALVRAVGVESEMELAFAGVHQVCAPLLDLVDRLPGPQRDALRVVFGLTDGTAPDRFLVGLAVLSLMSEAAEARPLLCVVDDAQWLDQASARTLGFVARRVLAEPVGFVFAAREPGEDLQPLPDLEVRGLVNGEARALLGATVRFRLDPQIRDRIIAETRGNPLALLELPRGLTATQLAGGFGLPDADLSRRIERSYVRRLEHLPEDARRLLLVAAAEPVGDPLLLQRACERLGVALSAVDATDGLLALDDRVIFPHPLARSAVYGDADPQERRAAHRALADVTDSAADPDRRAWHLAAATAGPDEAVARELERSAGRAQARGGLAAAAALRRRAVALTGDPARRAERALAAAQASLGAGAFDATEQLLTTAQAGPLDGHGHARVGLVRAELRFAQRRGGDAAGLLLEAARQLEPRDLRLARDTYLEAWAAALFAGHLAEGAGLADVSRAIAAAPPAPDPPFPRDLLLDAFGLVFTRGRQAAAPRLRRAVDAFAGDGIAPGELLRWGWQASRAANFLWDNERSLAIATRTVELARETGALAALSVADNACGQAAAFAGDLTSTALLAAEVEAIKEATRTRVPPHAGIALAGLSGRDANVAQMLAGVIEEATDARQGATVQYAHWASAVYLNGTGRYMEALAHARVASECLPQLYIAWWALAELVEAAARTENAALAGQALERLGEQTAGATDDWPQGLLSLCRALAADGAAAERLYRDAISRLDRARMRPQSARAHLLYGEWLRREHRRADARVHLRLADDQCTAIGMRAFAERARGELLATGERTRRRTTETRDDLTAQELHIAGLARQGLSNPEIGARLFLSPRTVEWHLRKVFAKLGIRSRQELDQALPRVDVERVAS
jgi:DNA-binding CsgD family transcriptional regulator